MCWSNLCRASTSIEPHLPRALSLRMLPIARKRRLSQSESSSDRRQRLEWVACGRYSEPPELLTGERAAFDITHPP